VRVNEWLSRIEAGKTYHDFEGKRVNVDVVERVAEDLIARAGGKERTLLSKSLQEAIYYAVRFDPDIDYDELNARISRYLHRWGKASFIKRFLSLFFCNFVQFHTGESFRALADGSFEASLEGIGLTCQRTVASVWKAFERTKRPLDLRTAEKLVSDIEQRLRGI
jgi:hypothetical protein